MHRTLGLKKAQATVVVCGELQSLILEASYELG